MPACCCGIFRVQCIKECTGHQRHQCHKQISSLHYNCCLRRWRLWPKLPLEEKGTASIISPGTTRWFLPLFKYADIIWDNCTSTQASTLENLHLEAIRIIIGSVRGTSHHNLYNESGFCTLKERHKRHKLIQFHTMINKICPDFLWDLLPPLVLTTNPYHRRASYPHSQLNYAATLSSLLLHSCGKIFLKIFKKVIFLASLSAV